MPTVGSGKTAKKFPYTKRGEQAAKKLAKKTGQKLIFKKGQGAGYGR